MYPRAHFIVLLLILGVSGCTSEIDDDAGVAETQVPRVSGAAGSTGVSEFEGAADVIELVDCMFYPATFDAPEATVRPFVPSEYELFGWTPGIVQVNLHVTQCTHFAINNSTVGQETLLASALVRVVPPGHLSEGTDLHFYNIETFLSNEDLAAVMAKHGVPAVAAEITLAQDDVSYTAVIASGGQTIYELRGGYGTNEASGRQDVQRDHFQSPQGTPGWMDIHESVRLAAIPHPALLIPSSGFLSQAWGAPSPAVTGMVSQGTLHATITFGATETSS